MFVTQFVATALILFGLSQGVFTDSSLCPGDSREIIPALVEEMVGEPDFPFIVGSSFHACYARARVELVYDADELLPKVEPLHRRMPRGLRSDVRAEMSRLEGWWQEDPPPGPFGTGTILWFNGDMVVATETDIALGFYYKIDAARVPHVLELYYPNARNDASWKAFFKKAGEKGLPRRWICKFEGTRLLLCPESARGRADEKEAKRYKRVPTPKGFGK